MPKTFDEICEALLDHARHIEEHKEEMKPFLLSKPEAIITFSTFEEQMKDVPNAVGNTVISMAIREGMNNNDYSYLARLMREEMILCGVPLVPGWGKRETVGGETVDKVRYQVDLMGSDPDSCMILQSAGRYVTTAMDYR